MADATRFVKVIQQVVSQQTESGAGVDYQYGVVAGSDGIVASAYLSGDTSVLWEEFRLQAGMYVQSGDYAMFGIDSRGHRWIEQLLPTSLYSRLIVDPIRGQILVGGGDDPASLPWKPADIKQFPTYTTENTLTSFAGQWGLIASGQINEKYGSVGATMLLNGYNSVAEDDLTWPKGIVQFRVGQSVDYGNDPPVEVDVSLSHNIDATDFKVIITDNTGPSFFSVYARVSKPNSWLEYMPLWSLSDRGNLRFVTCSAFVAEASLPAGTQSLGGYVNSPDDILTEGYDIVFDDSSESVVWN